MKSDMIKTEIDVKGSKINVVRVNGYEYISLTDLAKTQNDEAPADVVKNWLRNKETISQKVKEEQLSEEKLAFLSEKNKRKEELKANISKFKKECLAEKKLYDAQLENYQKK